METTADEKRQHPLGRYKWVNEGLSKPETAGAHSA